MESQHDRTNFTISPKLNHEKPLKRNEKYFYDPMNYLLKQFSYLVHFLADYIPTCSKHFLFLFCQIWHVIEFSLNFQSTKITFILWISPANGQTFSHCFHSLGSLTTRFVSHLNGSGQTLPNRVISAMFCSGFFGRGSVVTLTEL